MHVHNSDAEEFDALAQGHVSAFEELYHRYKQPVYTNIAKLVRQPEAAEDLLQEVFSTLWEKRHVLDFGHDVGGWLFVVSYNKAITYLKKQLKVAALVVHESGLADGLPQPPAPDEELFEHQLALVEEAVCRLPARKQQVFRLCRFEGKSCEEVAAIVGVSAASVRGYLKQATQQVRAQVQARAGVGYLLLLLLAEQLG